VEKFAEGKFMRRRLYIYALLSVCFALSHARAQQDFSKVQMKVTKVAGNVYMIEGAGGNIGVSAGADGILIVDDQFAPLADKIRAALKEINPGQLRFVLNTHYHGDHTGSNAVFGKEATIIAHDNVRARLAAEQTLGGQKIPASPKDALPVITYAQSVSIHFNGEEIRVIHFPAGHTDGDSMMFFHTSNVIHMGDHFFAGRFPYIDLEHGGSVEGLTKNIEAIIARVPADVKIIPGHGPLSTLGDLKLYRRMLTETTALVRKGMAEGKTLEQLRTAGLPDEWKTWGAGFINTNSWIETIFNSFSKDAKK
jgi:cyclase